MPMEGTFVGSSNWVNLAGSGREVYGIQSDGSLWKVFSNDLTVRWHDPANLSAMPQPERIGSELDWKTVASGTRHFLALKANGTIWGWGDNEGGQIGPGGKEFTNGLVRIGVESDWLAVFASGDASVGVKSDGSVWKWGWLHVGPNRWEKWKQGPHPDPVRWNLAEGTGWLALTGETRFDLALHQNGTLWASGNLPQNLFGQHFDREVPLQFSRIGKDSDWANVAGSWNSLAAIKKDGTLFLNDVNPGPVFWRGHLRKPSKFSDWIAVETGAALDMALAADGTLSAWGEPFNTQRLFGPTRKPLWSVNILAQSNSPGNTR